MSIRLRIVACLVLAAAGRVWAATAERPNVILFLCDNLGYGDTGPFGSTRHRTPNLDRLAREGMKLTHCYAASGVCTPSRAALLTGSYPVRVSLHANARGGPVLQPVEPIGLHPDEWTLAEMLRELGYATAMIGKWHLGDQPEFLPTRQGFESYFGVPYSDDMTERPGQPWPPLPLMRDEAVIEAPVDRNLLTVRETEAAIRFLEEKRERPFFLYLAHAMPGSTLAPFSSPAFSGKSKNGAWGDAVEELDWSVGEILGALRRLGLEQNTLVIWTSDNGAPQRNPPQGSNHPLGGAGYTVAEGGMRVPALVRWPGRVPAGAECAELVTLMDVLPTLAALTGGHWPAERPIDGKDIMPLLRGEAGARSPHAAFFYYTQDQLQAVRAGQWKLYLALEERLARNGKRERAAGTAARLFDVVNDPGETRDVFAEHPDVVTALVRHADWARAELGDLGRPGRAQRPAGKVTEPRAQRLPGR